ncbi:MAG: SurA N-terminal domain-containing protein [Candidatus Bipolaricaulota bacterium]
MLTTVAALLMTACLSIAGLAGEPAAIVDGEEITQEELEGEAGTFNIIMMLFQQPQYQRFAMLLYESEEGRALQERYKREVLDDMIDRKLQRQEAERLGITADEAVVQDMVDGELDSIKQQNQLTQQELEAALAQQGRTLEGFREQIAVDVREHLVREALMEEVTADVTVSEEEALEFYEDNPDQYSDEEGELLPFEEVQESVEQDLLSQKRQQVWEDRLAELREEADITINL